MLDEIDFCIKTWKRPQALRRLCDSIQRFYPDAKVTINADRDVVAGRNEMVRVTKRPFLLFLDDDFIFTEETRIEFLHAEIESSCNHGAVGGVVMDVKNGVRVPRHSGGNLRRDDRTLYLTCDLRDGIHTVTVVPNFFLARRDVFDECRWRFGMGAEHTDFFWQMRHTGWAVRQHSGVLIDHDLEAPALDGYKADRWGGIGEPIARMMDHWGIDTIIVNGKVVHSRPLYA